MSDYNGDEISDSEWHQAEKDYFDKLNLPHCSQDVLDFDLDFDNDPEVSKAIEYLGKYTPEQVMAYMKKRGYA